MSTLDRSSVRRLPRAESLLDEARRVANGMLLELPPERQVQLVAQAHAAGITWLGPRPVTWGDDAVISTAEAAELVSVTDTVIRKWHSRGLLPNIGRRGRYRVSAVLDAAAAVRRDRAARGLAEGS